jgi:hypothetical protein
VPVSSCRGVECLFAAIGVYVDRFAIAQYCVALWVEFQFHGGLAFRLWFLVLPPGRRVWSWVQVASAGRRPVASTNSPRSLHQVEAGWSLSRWR